MNHAASLGPGAGRGRAVFFGWGVMIVKIYAVLFAFPLIESEGASFLLTLLTVFYVITKEAEAIVNHSALFHYEQKWKNSVTLNS